MTDLTHDDSLDRQIRTFLEWHAQDLAEAPTATEMAVRVGAGRPGFRAWPPVPAQMRWAIVAVLLVAAIATAAALVGMIPPQLDRGPRAYEAIFLRLEAVESQIDVVVIGVNAKGVERVIAHLPTPAAQTQYGANGPNALLGSAAAVSPSGLLALPRTTGNYLFRWQVVDLHRLGRAPIDVPGFEQDYDVRIASFGDTGTFFQRPLAVWGPDDRVAITMYKRASGTGSYFVSLLNGRTGVGTSLPPPDGQYLPFWAADGSGLHVALNGQPGVEWVLRPDGTLHAGSFGFADDGHGRRIRGDGTPVDPFPALFGAQAAERAEVRLLADAGIELGDVAWTADGNGTWLLGPATVQSDGLVLDRVVAGKTTTAATLDDPLAGPGQVVVGWLAGLAPDDSMVIVGHERYFNFNADQYESGGSDLELVVPGMGAHFVMDGFFAGWLEVPA